MLQIFISGFWSSLKIEVNAQRQGSSLLKLGKVGESFSGYVKGMGAKVSVCVGERFSGYVNGIGSKKCVCVCTGVCALACLPKMLMWG